MKLAQALMIIASAALRGRSSAIWHSTQPYFTLSRLREDGEHGGSTVVMTIRRVSSGSPAAAGLRRYVCVPARRYDPTPCYSCRTGARTSSDSWLSRYVVCGFAGTIRRPVIPSVLTCEHGSNAALDSSSMCRLRHRQATLVRLPSAS